MSQAAQSVTVTFDRSLVAHPGALHLKRMRIGIWLYLYLLAHTGPGETEVSPAAVAGQMGLKEGTIRSWLGHLRKGGYLNVKKSGAELLVSLPDKSVPEELPRASPRYFTVDRVQEILGEVEARDTLEAALLLYPDRVIQRALAGALAVPDRQIKKSRTALFLYLLKRYGTETQSEADDPGH
jgi:hypothetical protein